MRGGACAAAPRKGVVGYDAMSLGGRSAMPRRVAIVGGGVSGLGAAWALHHHPDRFDFRLFEAHEQIGGNAITVDMPQDDGSAIPFDISVTACIRPCITTSFS